MTTSDSQPPEMPDGPEPTAEIDPAATDRSAALLERALFEVKRVVVGQDAMVERMLIALLARGHLLLEGVPGVAKTLAVRTLADVIGGSFHRLQFTPDLMPGDIVGTRVWRPSTETFDTELGPVFANLVLADEINRAPAKVQSALLEAMAERQVSIGGRTYALPDPFLVIATQNPIESEGVYALPGGPARPVPDEGRRDPPERQRGAGHPAADERGPAASREVLAAGEVLELQQAADRVFVHHAVAQYAVALVMATRDPVPYGLQAIVPHVEFGASPRATLGLIAAGRALALMRARDYVLPYDVYDVASDVLSHRLVLTFDAVADGIDPRHTIDYLLSVIPQPQIAPHQDPREGQGQTTGQASGQTPRSDPTVRGGMRSLAESRQAFATLELAVHRRLAGAAVRRPPGPRARAGHRAGGGGALPARRGRRAPDRLERHRAHRRDPRLAHPRRARGRHLGPRRRDRQHGLRHGRRGEGRPGRLGHRRHRAAERRPRQPDGRAAPRRRRAGVVASRSPRTAPSGRCPRPVATHEAASAPPAGTRPSLAEALSALDARHRRHGIRVVVSDFVEPDGPSSARSPGSSALRRLAARHDVLVVEVVDPRELELSRTSARWSSIDPETGHRCEVWTSSPRIRDQYAELAAAHRTAVAAAVRASGAEHLVLRTDRDWVLDLARFVRGRRRPRARQGSSMTFLSPWWLLLLVPVALMAAAYVVQQSPPQQVRRPVRLAADARATDPASSGLAPPPARHRVALRVRPARLRRRPPRDGRAGAARERHRDRGRRRLELDAGHRRRPQPARRPPRRRRRSSSTTSPQGFNVGVVTFSGTTEVRAAPTDDRRTAVAALKRLTLGPRTAIGDGVFTSLDQIEAVASPGQRRRRCPASWCCSPTAPTPSAAPPRRRPPPRAQAGVPVSTIAYGTPTGTVEIDGQLIPVPVDKETLADLADLDRRRGPTPPRAATSSTRSTTTSSRRSATGPSPARSPSGPPPWACSSGCWPRPCRCAGSHDSREGTGVSATTAICRLTLRW